MAYKPFATRHLEVLKVLRQNREVLGRSVRLQELCELTGVKSAGQICNILNRLEAEGFIQPRTRQPRTRQSRAIKLSYRGIHGSLDGDRSNVSAKKSAAGKKGKGVDALTSKKDPFLQARIDQVVAKALANVGNGMDVMRDHRRHSLKASRVG